MGVPAQQPRLGDLYVLESEPIEFVTKRGSVWLVVRKLDPLDKEEAGRRAGAVRARVMATRGHRDSREYLSLLSQALDADRSTVVDLLIGEEVAKRRMSVEAELELGEGDEPGEPTKWGKDGYLQGLIDQWKDLQFAFQDAEHKDHESAKRVFAEIKDFSDQVDARVAEHVKNLRRKKDKLSDEELAHEFTAYLVGASADQAWAREFARCKLWMGTYHVVLGTEGQPLIGSDGKPVLNDADEPVFYTTGDRYFPATEDGREEVDRLPETPRDTLVAAIEAISVEVIEGKDSQPPTPSWLSSEPSDAAETADSSGLVAATT